MKKFTVLLSLLLLVALLLPVNSVAVVAYPHPVEFKLPDGTTITIQLMGDEKVKWAETLDGYSILLNKEGFYEYAMLNESGDMVRSGIRAYNLKERSSSEKAFASGLSKRVTFSKSQVSIMKQIWEINQKEATKAFPTTGARKLICILIGYTDLAFTKTKAEFENLFNQVGYSAGGATGSVKDYYLENSYNQFNLTVDVAGPYTASQNMAYYGANDISGYDVRPRELVSEAINFADPTVNFADYDNDSDGWVDGVYIIYAGYGEEAGASANAIWAHAWSLASSVLKDGVYLQRYSCSAELRSNTGSTITAIGVICHEFGHVLGAPDYYDTDYTTGGQFSGTGQWDMMASGSWNNDGVTPAHHNGFTKVYYYQWAEATVISDGATITLYNAAENTNSFYRYNTTTSGEFFLLENREKHLFDAYIPGSGMIIYHAHSTVFSAGSSNTINDTHPQKMYPVAQNATQDPTSTPSTYGTINAATCTWTGTGKTEFSDASLPSSKSWAAANTSKPITNISRNAGNKTVTFDFMGGAQGNPTGFTATAASSSQINLSWTKSEGLDVLLAYNTTSTIGTPADGVNYSAGQSIPGGGEVLYVGGNETFEHTSLSANTPYYYKIWTKLNSTPDWSPGAGANATTLCDAIASLPFSENFNASTSLPNCWSIVDNQGNGQIWQFGTGGVLSGADGNYAFLNSDAYGSGNSQNADLVTPLLDLSNYSDITLSFIHYYRHLSSSATLSYSINGGSSWTQIQQWTASTSNPVTFNQVISGLAGQSQVKLKWNYTGSYGWYWSIDNIQITGSEVTNDPEPTNHATDFAVDAVVENTITLTWTDAIGDQLPSGYLIKASTIGYGDITAPVDGTPVSNSTLVKNVAYGVETVTFNGLAPETTHYFKIFPYSNAGANINYKTDGSVPQVEATTLTVSPVYCTGGPSSTADSNVENVTIAGESKTINHTGCPGVIGTQDLTVLEADVYVGEEYSVSVKYGTCGGNYGNAGTVWIDWNRNGVFESGEIIGTWTGTPPADPQVYPFTVPEGAYIGKTRMRVMQRESGTLPLDPCASYTWGSKMDFTIEVLEASTTQYSLTVNIVGSGTVEVDAVEYTIPVVVDENTILSLEALPQGGWSFDGWTGDLISANASESITMDADKTITATFIESGAPVVLVEWNFDDQDPIADSGIAENLSRTVSANTLGELAYYNDPWAGKSISYTAWDNGLDTKYWLIDFTTTNYESITISSVQRSSSTGPRDFKLQFRIDGIDWTDVPSANITVAVDYTTGVLSNLLLPVTTENQGKVYLRWIMTSNISVAGGTVASGGTSRIDNLVIKGTLMPDGVQHTLTLNTEGDGTTDPAEGTYYYNEGTTINLEAFPGANREFDSWSGDMVSTNNPESITMDTDKVVAARFSRPYYLSTTVVDGDQRFNIFNIDSKIAGENDEFTLTAVVWADGAEQSNTTLQFGYKHESDGDYTWVDGVFTANSGNDLKYYKIFNNQDFNAGEVLFTVRVKDDVATVFQVLTPDDSPNEVTGGNWYNSEMAFLVIFEEPEETSVTAIYNEGDIPSDFNFTALPGQSACPGALTVTIPEGAYIIGVDVEYDFTALGAAWIADQVSQLRCVSTGGTSEAALFFGSVNVAGTQSYSRTNLDIANGVTGGGDILFELHLGRQWGGAGCGTDNNRVDNGTWAVTVYYQMVPPAQYTLTMQQPDGLGTVVPEAGDYVYIDNQQIALTAAPAVGWEFTQWIGDVDNPNASETFVIMDSDKSVRAVFTDLEIPPVDVPFAEYFDGLNLGEIPLGWVSDISNWGAVNTNNAGGVSPEMSFTGAPFSTGTYRLVTPKITSGVATTLELSFKQIVNHTEGTYTLKVQTSTDGLNWTDEWTINPTGSTGQQVVSISLDHHIGNNFYLAWVFSGYSYNIGSWNIDDVLIRVAPEINPVATSITYGDELSASDLSGGTAAYDGVPVSGTFYFDDSSIQPNAGTYVADIYFVPDNSESYLEVSGTVNVTVNKATPEILSLPTASAITYGDALSESILSGGEANVPGTFAFDNPGFEPNTGNYEADVTFTPEDDNFNTVSEKVNVTVNRATPEVTTWPTASAITYGDELSESILSGGEASVDGSFEFDDPTETPNAGLHTADVTFIPADADNYNEVSGTVDVPVNKANPEVTTWPTASDITFGDELSESILSGGEASVDGSFEFDSPLETPVAGVYTADVTFIPTDADNYNEVSGTVDVTVNKANPEIISWPTASAITYGDALSESILSGGEASVDGSFEFDDPTETPNAGLYSADVTFIPTDTDNYNEVSGTIEVTVNKATATVTLSDLVHNYDGTPKEAGATTIPAGLTVVITYDGSEVKPVNAGTYVVVGTINDTNYQGSETNTFTINPADLTITANSFFKKYGEEYVFQGTEFTTSELYGSDAVTSVFLTSLGAIFDAPLGDYDIVPENATGSGLENYTIDYVNGTLTVTDKTVLHIEGLTASDKIYNGTIDADISDWGTLVGIENEDDVDLYTENAVATFGSKGVGVNKTVTVTGLELTGEQAENYMINNQTTTASITKRDLTLDSFTADSKIYDGGTTVTGTGFDDDRIEGDILSFTYNAEFEDKNIGTNKAVNYADIEVSGIHVGNYQLVSNTGIAYADILPIELTIGGSFTVDNKVYDGTTETTIVDNSLIINGIILFEDVQLANLEFQFNSKDAGNDIEVSITSALIVGDDIGNYTLTLDGSPTATADISMKALQITADNKSKLYGGTEPTLTATFDSFAVGEDISDLEGTLTISREPGEDVATYQITPSGVTSGNYNITFNTGTFTINKKPLLISADDKTKVYGSVDPSFSVQYAGFITGENATYLSGSLSIDRAEGENVGNYAITPSGLTSTNYAITYEDGNLSITKKTLNITADDKSKVYGDLDPAFTVVYGGFITGENSSYLTGSLSINRSAGENAGTYTITPSGFTSSNYNINYVIGTLTITKKSLLITAENKAKVYGDVDPVYTVTYNGFITGDNSSNLTGTLTFNRIAGENVGSYTITPSGLTALNYTITFETGTLTISKKPLLITADNKEKVYGSPEPTYTVTYNGFVLGDNVANLTGTLLLNRAAGENVGNYTITPSGLTSTNYNISFANGTLNITQKSLLISADDKEKFYGSADPVLTASYFGFIIGENAANLSGTLSINRLAGEDVGYYLITPSGLTSSNYAISFVDGILSINQKTLIITANDSQKVYGTSDPNYNVSYDGFIEGDDYSDLIGSLTFTREEGEAVGQYAVTPAGLSAMNYAIDYEDGTLTITPKELIITANSEQKVYGDLDPTFTVTYDGFIEGDGPADLIGALSFNRVAGENVGNYAVTPSGLTATNYAIDFEDGALTITPKTLHLTADDKEKVYGDLDPAFTASYAGFVYTDGVESLSGTLTFDRAAGEDVGFYSITPSGLTSTNYSILYVDGTLAINPKGLIISTNDSQKVYGSPDPNFTVSYEGFVVGDDATGLGGILAFDRVEGEDVGDYAVTPSGLTSLNYAIDFEDGMLSITPKPLYITADDKDKIYGEVDPLFTVAYDGFIDGDGIQNLEGELFIERAEGEDVGIYAIMPSGLTSTNYGIEFMEGTLTIAVKNLTIGGFFTVYDKEYDGTPDATINVNGLTLIGVVGDDDVELVNVEVEFASSSIGTDIQVNIVSASIAGSDIANYSVQLVGSPTALASILAPTHTLTLLVNPENSGTVTGSGVYSEGEMVEITAIPNVGYQFVSWTDAGGEIESTDAVFNFQMPTHDVSYTANFELVFFNLAVTVVPDNSGLVTGQGVYNMGDEVTLEASAYTGFQFLNWRIGGVTISSNNPYEFEMPASDLLVTAHFIDESTPLYALSLTVEPVQAGYAIGSGNYQEDEAVVIIAYANQGYQFVNWTDADNNEVSDQSTYAFAMPATDITLIANFELIEYSVILTVVPENAGTVMGGGAYQMGNFVTIEAIANDGFQFVSWTDIYGNMVNDNSIHTFSMPAGDVNLIANFVPIEYMVVVNIFPEGAGLVTGEGSYNLGDEVTLEAFSVEGYDFLNWRMNGVVISSENPYTFTMPAQDISITAYFIISGTETYQLTLAVNPENSGTVSGAGEYEGGEQINLNALANDGFVFVNWTDGEDNVLSTTASFTYTMPAADITLTANFEPYYSVTLLADPSNIGAVLTGSGDYIETAIVTIAASEVEGYVFAGWVGSIEDIELLDDENALETWFAMPSRDVILTATYEEYIPENYTVTFTVTDQQQVAIEGAMIWIDGTHELTTDAEGMASITLPNGTYSYEVSAEDYEDHFSSFTVAGEALSVPVTMIVVGIDDGLLSNLKVYPNPFRSSITLENAENVSKVLITNLIGQKVKEIKLGGSERITIPVGELTNGIYMITFQTEGGERIIRKMVKE
jgi:M6 family metalloprotease-like protein/uncharacterized repeat protein (TIGR02543 family)